MDPEAPRTAPPRAAERGADPLHPGALGAGEQAALFGLHGLFAGMHQVAQRLANLEARALGEGGGLERELEALRTFVQSLHARLQAHDDFVRNPKFLQGVEEHSLKVVLAKCQPDLWRLEQRVGALSDAVLKLGTEPGAHGKASTNNSSLAGLVAQVEDVVLRLAAFGNERIDHLEIVGDSGKRYKDGTARRILANEKDLREGRHKLPVPRAWRADSDARTINNNFAQLGRMINEMVLGRLDEVEARLDTRLDRLDKRVDILSALFHKLNTETKRLGELHADRAPSAAAAAAVASESQDEAGAEVGSRSSDCGGTSGGTSGGAGTALAPAPAGERALSRRSVAVVTTEQPARLPAESAAAVQKTEQAEQATEAATAQGGNGDGPAVQRIAEQPRKSHQSGARAGRAAFNRARRHQHG